MAEDASGFITDFGIKKAAEANLPRYGVWEWNDDRGRYEVVETASSLGDLSKYAEYEIVPFHTERQVGPGEIVVTPDGEGVVTSINGGIVRVVPKVASGIDFMETEYELGEVKLALLPGGPPSPQGIEASPNREELATKSWTVSLPSYPPMLTEATSEKLALENVIVRLIESSSNKKISYMGEEYGPPGIGRLVNRIVYGDTAKGEKPTLTGPSGVVRESPSDGQMASGRDNVEGNPPPLQEAPPLPESVPSAAPEASPEMVAQNVADEIIRGLRGESDK